MRKSILSPILREDFNFVKAELTTKLVFDLSKAFYRVTMSHNCCEISKKQKNQKMCRHFFIFFLVKTSIFKANIDGRGFRYGY